MLKSEINLVSLLVSGETVSTVYVGHYFGLLYQPRMIDDDECGADGGMRISRENPSTRRKPFPLSLCPPQIPHNLTWVRTRVATVGNQRLTA
jgi:hypothetical protein